MACSPFRQRMTTTPLQELSAHPAIAASPFGPVRVGAQLAADGGLVLEYLITAPPGLLLVPPRVAPTFADELWQHTCCEAFVAPAGGKAYREFNFSPSGAWAVYDFTDYRQRLAVPPPALAPAIDCQTSATGLKLRATLLRGLLPEALPWQIGLTVVLETMAGDKSWWALAHTADRPDFHPIASFTLALTRHAS
jgi:hypothetical protein